MEPAAACQWRRSRTERGDRVHHLPSQARRGDDFASFFLSAIRPELERSGPIDIVASFQSERAANTFPRLPIREGETVFVWLARHRDLAAYATHVDRLAGAESWTKKVLPEMRRRTWRKNHVARLAPTLRSAIR